MKAIKRLHQYIELKNIKPTPFEAKIGLSNGYLGKQLKRDADLGEGVIIKIIEYCLDLNPIWLLTGVGEMLNHKYSSISQRIEYSLNTMKHSENLLLKNVNISKTNYQRMKKGEYTPTTSEINDISKYLDVTIEWLENGEGSINNSKTGDDTFWSNNKSGLLRSKENISNNHVNSIPLVSMSAAAGFGTSDFAIQEHDVKDYYVIPKFKDRKIDFMIEVSGSSMYPKYNSGDVVACRVINNSDFIQWNKVHVIGTSEQGLLIKRLKQGESLDCLQAISDNKDYDPFLIPKSEITGMAIVVGVIRLE